MLIWDTGGLGFDLRVPFSESHSVTLIGLDPGNPKPLGPKASQKTTS